MLRSRLARLSLALALGADTPRSPRPAPLAGPLDKDGLAALLRELGTA